MYTSKICFVLYRERFIPRVSTRPIIYCNQCKPNKRVGGHLSGAAVSGYFDLSSDCPSVCLQRDFN